MHLALKALALAGLATVAACGGNEPSDQNVAVENLDAPSDVDVLPADESSSPAGNAVVNGTTDDLNVATPDNQTDSY
jgi:hypothetical protein